MYDLIKKLRSLNEREELHETTDVKLEVVSNGGVIEVDHPDKIRILYKFWVEFRSWGIKDIEISILDNIEFNVDIDGTEYDIVIRPGDVEIEWEAGSHYIPSSLYVVLEDGKVKSAELTVYFIGH